MLKNKNVPKKSIAIIFISIICISTFSAFLFSSPRIFKQREHEVANVLLFSKGDDDSLIDSLTIDYDVIHLTVITKDNINEKFNQFLLFGSDVVIIDGFMPENTDDLQLLVRCIQERNVGLIFFGGLNNDEKEDNDFSSTQINIIAEVLPVNLKSNYRVSTDDKTQIALGIDIEYQKLNDKGNSNILVKHVEWLSCPLIEKRMIVEAKSSATQILETIEGDFSIVSEWDVSGGGKVVSFNMVIHGYNDPFVLWPYFNYLMYASIFHVKAGFLDSGIESYAEWPFSPIPHTFEIILWFSMIGCLWVITIYLYFKMRRREIPEVITKHEES